MSQVGQSNDAIDGRVFVAEKHVVDETSESLEHVIVLRSVLFAFRIHVTCRFPQYAYCNVVRYLVTYRRYLRDDTSITKVTIYRGIW